MSHAAEYPSPNIVDSRRLMGPNVYSDREGVLLEVRGAEPSGSVDETATRERWRVAIASCMAALGMPEPVVVERRTEDALMLYASAPIDVLMTATEVNEQAWVAAETRMPISPAEIERLHVLVDAERRAFGNAAAVHATAIERHCTVTVDDDSLSLGSGIGSRTWTFAELPPVDEIPWATITDIPIALVTGSNGKTTTTRLLSAMWRNADRVPGWCCSDGVWVGDEQREFGDYSGPAGARAVLRDGAVQAAVLETARGGILRRGLAVHRATAAIITNIAADHFGEYGVHSLQDLMEAKAVVALAVRSNGRLVLNADDATLVDFATRTPEPVVWFSERDDNPVVLAHLYGGGDACVVSDGRVVLHANGAIVDLGAVHEFPLTLGGAARHNIANALGAAMMAFVCGVSTEIIRRTLHTFGLDATDNPGRLQLYRFGGAQLLVDYAHNPDGLAALCQTANAIPAVRRLLVLGQAGNRDNAQLRALADAAFDAARFDRIVVKEMPSMLRGRPAGEVSGVLITQLIVRGINTARLEVAPTELHAMRRALAWARDGDVLLCPVHAEQSAVLLWLSALADAGWTTGTPLPPY